MALTLGIDASTQSVSAIVLDTASPKIVAEASVNFGKDLPHYDAPNGFIPGGQGGEVHSDPRMWIDALELCLQRLKRDGFDLSVIDAISGAGQQHGTVYLNEQWLDIVSNLKPSATIREQVEKALSRDTSPIWMDSSTSAECAEIADAVGGNAEVCKRSGSIAIERFSGPQIRRFAKTQPDTYAATTRIHLVSSFIASLLAGKDAPIDHGDGAGMNLLNLETLTWDDALLDATADGLVDKLPPAVPAATVVGTVAPYFVEKYGFKPDAQVIAFTGDNPSSLVGMGASQPGKIVISLGTSDTLFAAMSAPHTDPNGYGHVFGNPMGGFMSLVCFLNGSLARENVKAKLGVEWDAFDVEGLAKTPVGNNGNAMIPFFGPEITPLSKLKAPVLDGSDSFIDWSDAPAVIRATLEGQFINMWLHTRWIGVETDTIYLTGGASQNNGIAQVVADVFEARVVRIAVPGSVALGGALRAAEVLGCNAESIFQKLFSEGSTSNTLPRANACSALATLKSKLKAMLDRMIA